MQKQFQGHIDHHQLCKTTDKILLAVSGGLDSMVMFHLFLAGGYSVAAAHCNFQLRGKESDEDEAFVKRQCEQHNVPFYSTRFSTATYAHEHGISIQMAARTLRYEWFSELLKSEKLDKLATAHHLNDSLETVLLNLTHGTDLHGMTGIPVKHGSIIRPLLFATRHEVETFAASHQIIWREDISNAADHYQRNFMRQHIIPQLKKLNPSLEKTILTTQSKLMGELILMKAGLESFMSKYVVYEDGRVLILKTGLQNHSHPASVLWEMIKWYGFNFDQCNEVIESMSGQSGKKFCSPTHQLIVDREYLMVVVPKDVNEQVEIKAGQSVVSLGSMKLKIQQAKPVVSKAPSVASLDAAKVEFPLLWRRWQSGDSFYPLGMTGRKKVSDFLIDEKISIADKALVTVVVSKDEIIWVVGYRIDDRYKITSSTKSALELRLERRLDQNDF